MAKENRPAAQPKPSDIPSEIDLHADQSDGAYTLVTEPTGAGKSKFLMTMIAKAVPVEEEC
jgi:energy-coupling factor transporter ATP-binding protein EcfA2